MSDARAHRQTAVTSRGPVSAFLRHHYRHFNAAALIDAAKGYVAHLDAGGKMFVTLAGAMSTAELGLSLAEMIRQGKVHGICCTGANLEEDMFNLVAHDHYVRVPHYRDLTPADEQALLDRHMNRVTDTCIPEEEAMRRIETVDARRVDGRRSAASGYFPHEFMYRVLRRARCSSDVYQIDPQTSGCCAAMERKLPIFVPGWEDSTLGNMFAALCIDGEVKNRAYRSHRHRVHAWPGRLVHGGIGRADRSASSRSAAASPATSRSASCRCCDRT